MKNKIAQLLAKGVKTCWTLLSHNFGLKVLSLAIAILLWNFVITTNLSLIHI